MSAKNKEYAVIGAMDVEVEALKNAMRTEGKTTEHDLAGMKALEGTLSDVPVIVTQCNVGMVNAAAATQALIDAFPIAGVLNTGVAGSLDAGIDIGDIVIATDAVNHIMDVRNLGYEAGQTPGLDTKAFPADGNLSEAAVTAAGDLGITVHRGRVASGDRFVRDMLDKNCIIDNFNASCCEMEGAAIAQVCYLNETPFAILRAISDKADGTDHIDYPSFEEQAAKDCARLVMKTLEHLR